MGRLRLGNGIANDLLHSHLLAYFASGHLLSSLRDVLAVWEEAGAERRGEGEVTGEVGMGMDVTTKLAEIKEHPELHRHDFWELQDCCIVNGALDSLLMEAHPELGRSGGQKCDVTSGPCSCGGWH